jgi:Polyketide cyclase / dehydrase and lipid transport
MSFWVMPVRLPAVEAVVTAPTTDVFEWVTSFTTNTSAGGSRVLSTEENGDLVCEFVSVVVGLLGRRKVHRTVERVTLEPPGEVRFQGMQGPLDLLRDRFTLTEVSDGTLFRYESTVGLPGSVFGWLLCQTYVRAVLGRFMRDHVAKIRDQFAT